MRRTMVLLGTVAAAVALMISASSALGMIEYIPRSDRDVAVSASTAPATAVAGSYAVLSALVQDRADFTALVAFNDTVPNGLAIQSATAAGGSCTVSGQVVACRIRIEEGGSAPVNIVVTPATAGTYVNQVSVQPTDEQRDPNPTNDSASATLTVVEPGPAVKCTVPALKDTPLPVAKRLLRFLHCKAGKATPVHSRSAGKGQVIKTTPKAGSYKAGKAVGLTVSSGPAKAKRKPHPRR